ncbi:MAG: YheU family protein [Thermodesulfobacteriota bacterium]
MEEFITREGTDYGAVEASLEKKVQEVMDHLRTGNVVVVFDRSTESCNIVFVTHIFGRHSVGQPDAVFR